MGTKSRETIYGASIRAAAERATEARREADRLAVEGFIDLGRLGLADRHADLALVFANTADTFPGFAEDASAGLAAGYPAAIDEDRLRFYLALDPLTWG